MSGEPNPPTGEEPTEADEGPRAGDGASPVVTALLAWAMPGLGHLRLGRRGRAVAFCAIVLVSLATGLALDGNLYRVVPEQPLSMFATIGCMGMGLPYFIARWGFGYEGDIEGAGYEYGSAFILTAGLMNLLLILDALDIARGMKS
jgi:hypothetical protein